MNRNFGLILYFKVIFKYKITASLSVGIAARYARRMRVCKHGTASPLGQTTIVKQAMSYVRGAVHETWSSVSTLIFRNTYVALKCHFLQE